MKKAVLIILAVVLVLALAAGGLAAAGWHRAGQVQPPQPPLRFAGGEVDAYGWAWAQPALWGLLHRDMGRNTGTQPTPLGEVDAATAAEPPALPEGAITRLAVTRNGGAEEELAGSWFGGGPPAPGSYEVKATAALTAEDGGAGEFYYWFTFTVAPAPQDGAEGEADAGPAGYQVPDAPVFETGPATLQQGDVFSMQLRGIPEGVTPTASSELGLAIFTPMGEGRWTAAVPVANTRQPGSYGVQVQAGAEHFSATVTVTAYDYDVQDLQIDLSDPDISEANSYEAIQQYNQVILAARAQADDTRYWSGTFIQPTQGELTTHFGQIRYTNGDYDNPSIHWGMDIASKENPPILASNAGRVEFADYLLAVGYTVILEHGGGLKSYHFHMSALTVEKDQLVEKGQQIGVMGSTGYSTGDHLHFEVRIGSQAISPEMLFLPQAGLYAAEQYGLKQGGKNGE